MSASWDGGVSPFHFGVTVTLTFDLVSRINIESGAYLGIEVGIPNLVYGCIFGW